MKVDYRRKREGKTDYHNRLKLLKSKTDRLVIRKTNSHVYAQIVQYSDKGDKIIASANSKDLIKLGYKNSTSNNPAAYLTGLLLAKRSKSKKAVLDLGLQTVKRNSRIFGCMKGCVDGGLDVPHSDTILPNQERLEGNHIEKFDQNNFNQVKEKILGK